MLLLFSSFYTFCNRSYTMTIREPSEDWLIQPPPDTPDIHMMNLEQWRAAVERWCQQFETNPAQKAPLNPQEKALVKAVLQQAAETHTKRLAGGA
jgi:hypothetical protein